jgi:hypothetical protein
MDTYEEGDYVWFLGENSLSLYVGQVVALSPSAPRPLLVRPVLIIREDRHGPHRAADIRRGYQWTQWCSPTSVEPVTTFDPHDAFDDENGRERIVHLEPEQLPDFAPEPA